MNKNVIIGILAIVAVGLGIWAFVPKSVPNSTGDKSQNDDIKSGDADKNGGSPTSTDSGTSARGSIFFSITDAAADMGAVSSIDMTVDKVEMHSEGQGWVTVSETPKTFDLLALKSKSRAELLAKADITADTYNQVRFHVKNITVTESGQKKQARLPSNEFKMNGAVKVIGNGNSSAQFDILADQSLHKTGKGEYIFAPVVKFESRSNASVKVDSDDAVTVTGGNRDESTSAGMDVSGEVKVNFQLKMDSNLEIEGSVIRVKGDTKGNVNLNL